MKVSELITELSKQDGNDPVLLRVYAGPVEHFYTDPARVVRRTTRQTVVIEGEGL